MSRVYAADYYESPGDLAVITTHFNAAKYPTLLDNYQRFQASMQRSGIKLVTVELAFGNEPFELIPADSTIQVRSNSILWQRERLVNLGVQSLPDTFQKIAWIDADVFFEDPLWAVNASAALEDSAIVQLFDRAVHLEQGVDYYMSPPSSWESSFASVHRNQGKFKPGADWAKHGHTGFAWAARRQILTDCGFYEGCSLGGADHLMAHAMYQEQSSECAQLAFHGNRAHYRHYKNWADHFSKRVNGSVQNLSGTVLHRWHGNPSGRSYHERNRALGVFCFDPGRDLRSNADGCFEWNTDNRELVTHCSNYLVSRHEGLKESTDHPSVDSFWFGQAQTPGSLHRALLCPDSAASPITRRLRQIYRSCVPLSLRLRLHDLLTCGESRC